MMLTTKTKAVNHHHASIVHKLWITIIMYVNLAKEFNQVRSREIFFIKTIKELNQCDIQDNFEHDDEHICQSVI
jgi:hypothetical protein